MSNLSEQIHLWSSWRAPLRHCALEFAEWLEQQGLMDPSLQARVDRILAGIDDETLKIAVVGEVSRGKSELINAIFAPEYGHRLLPAFPGRSTMCPTELRWDPAEPPSLRLLPIETRADETPLSELRQDAGSWQILPLDPGDRPGISQALERLTDVKSVTVAEARRYALGLGEGALGGETLTDDDIVEIPRWRHAIVNFPHPLLANGVVILDTPGLNAIGSEPELTLNMLPSAHVLLFVLSVDTGVTRSDLEAWRNHLAPIAGQRTRHFLVLNKIDMLWGGLRGEAEVASHVAKQVDYVSRTLRVAPKDVIPLSAMQGFVASVIGDAKLSARSGLPALQQALIDRLTPGKRDLIREAVHAEWASLLETVRSLLETRVRDIAAELGELRRLRNSKFELLGTVLLHATAEKDSFDYALAEFQDYRSRFARLSNALFANVGMDALEAEARKTLDAMKGSLFSPGLRQAMRSYFEAVGGKLTSADKVISEIHMLADEIYGFCRTKLGATLERPRKLSLSKRRRDLARIEEDFRKYFDRFSTMLTYEHVSLTRRFFKTVASQVRWNYLLSNSEAKHWLDAIIVPVERQIKERQTRLRDHLQSVKRLHERTADLEGLIAELTRREERVVAQLEQVRSIRLRVEPALARARMLEADTL